MDGFSLLYFFNDLYSLYQSYLSDQLVPSILSDFTTYQIVTEKYLSLEKETYLIKKDFWKNYLKKNISKLPHQKDFYDYDSVTKSFVLSKRYVKNIYSFRKRHDIDVLSLFTSIYYKALQNIFDITTVRLRVASSLRHHLKSPSERRLLASLACSFPLIINASNKKEHSLIAHANKVQIKNLVQHLPLNPLPWNQDDFKSFSALKERYLTLSLSCFVYRKNGFLTSRQEFHWVESLMDMILMIGISKESIYLIFSYKKNIFDDLEVKKLYKQIKEEVYAL